VKGGRNEMGRKEKDEWYASGRPAVKRTNPYL
jgi:hypothetical protein